MHMFEMTSLSSSFGNIHGSADPFSEREKKKNQKKVFGINFVIIPRELTS